jgi:hypothetical protein
MNCKEFQILIDDYIEGNLAPAVKENFDRHKTECTICMNEYGETAKLLEMVESLPKETVPVHNLWSNIESRISDGKTSKRKIFSIKTPTNRFSVNGDDKKNKYLKYAAISLIAAMILVALLPSLFMNRNTPILDKVMTPYWKVTNLSGITIVASNIIGTVDSLKPGDWLETKDSSRAVLDVPGLGSVTIEPNTKLKIVKSDTNEQRISLEYGTINANINAKPRTFYVDSKSATAIDLGCSYTYTVYQNGDGILYVKQGMVSLQAHGRESLVPEGKFCLAKPGIGPGTPFRENTSAALKDALIKYDFEKGGEKEVETILKNAQRSDVVTLINLLSRVDEANKTKVYYHISHYAPPPKNIPKDSIPRIDIQDLNEWIQKYQKEWKDEMQKNMKDLKENLKNLNKELKESLSKLPDSEYHNGEFNEELQHKIQENLEKHLDKLQNLDKIMVIPNEIIEKSIQESLEKASEELEKNGDKIQREMERLQERMQRMNERMQENMERQKEREEELKERQQEREEEIKEREKDREEEIKEREKEREEEMKEREKERKEMEKEKEYNDKWKNFNFNYNFNYDNEKDVSMPESPEAESPDTPEMEQSNTENNNTDNNSNPKASQTEVKSPEANEGK